MSTLLGTAIEQVSKVRAEYGNDPMIESILRIAHNQMVNIRMKLLAEVEVK